MRTPSTLSVSGWPMLLETIMLFVWKMEIVSTDTILIMLQASCNECYCHSLFCCLVCMLFLLHERKCIHWSSVLAVMPPTHIYLPRWYRGQASCNGCCCHFPCTATIPTFCCYSITTNFCAHFIFAKFVSRRRVAKESSQ